MDKVFESLSANAERDCTGKVVKERFIVDGVELCQNSYVLCLGIARRSLLRVRKRVQMGAERRRPDDYLDPELDAELQRAPTIRNRHRSGKTQTILDWFNRVKSDGTCEKMPVGGVETGAYLYILPYYSREDTYKEWITEMTALQDVMEEEGHSIAKKSHFLTVWRTHFPDVKPSCGVGKVTFAHCNTCASARAQLQNVVNVEDLRIIRRNRVSHLLRQKLERRFYDQRKFVARVRNPGYCISAIVDCTEYKKCGVIRRKGRQSKDTDQKVLPQSLQTVFVHGRGVYNYSSHPHVNGGGGVNFTLECVMRTLSKINNNSGSERQPRVFYLQLDNCSGSNKNKFMLAWAQSLVDVGVFDEIVLSFLMVGHTHEDIDQLFSVISKGLKKRDIVTPEDFEEVVKTTLITAGHKHVYYELLDYQHDYKAWLEPMISTHLKYYAKPHVFCFVKDSDGVTRMRYKHWHRCFTWYPTPAYTAGDDPRHLPDVEDPEAQTLDDENLNAGDDEDVNSAPTSVRISDEFAGLRRLDEYVSETALTGRPKRRKKPYRSKRGDALLPDREGKIDETTETKAETATFQRDFHGVDLDAEVAAANGESYERPIDLPIGGSFYSREHYTNLEQCSFRKASGIVVMDRPMTLQDSPSRQKFVLDKRCPYGIATSHGRTTRYNSWVKQVRKILNGRTVHVTEIHREQWSNWFDKMEDIMWERVTAEDGTLWNWVWPTNTIGDNGCSDNSDASMPVDTVAGSVGSESTPRDGRTTRSETLELRASADACDNLDGNILAGLDDSDDGGDVVRHSENRVTGKEVRVGYENRLACVPTDLKEDTFILCARDIRVTDEYSRVRGYTEKESKLPILLCRVTQFTAAHVKDIPVEYWRQQNGNPNGKFRPFENDSRRRISGVADRATVLCGFASLTRSGAIPASVKRRLGEYNATGRGKTLKLKLPFIYQSGNGGRLIHVMDKNGRPGAIEGFQSYMEGHNNDRRRHDELIQAGNATLEREAASRKRKRAKMIAAGIIARPRHYTDSSPSTSTTTTEDEESRLEDNIGSESEGEDVDDCCDSSP